MSKLLDQDHLTNSFGPLINRIESMLAFGLTLEEIRKNIDDPSVSNTDIFLAYCAAKCKCKFRK